MTTVPFRAFVPFTRYIVRKKIIKKVIVIKHNTDYYWLRVNAINWSKLSIINEETEPAYDVSGLLSNDYDELGNQILIGLMYP